MHPRCGMPGFDLHDQPLAVLAGADDAANKRGNVTPPDVKWINNLACRSASGSHAE